MSSDHLRRYPGGVKRNFIVSATQVKITIVVIVMRIVSTFIVSLMMAVTVEAPSVYFVTRVIVINISVLHLPWMYCLLSYSQ